MNFVCSDLGDSPINLYHMRQNNTEYLDYEGNKLLRTTRLLDKNGSLYGYADEKLTSVMSSRKPDGVLRTISEFTTLTGLKLTTNFSINNKFDFRSTQIFETVSDFWLTIVVDDGVWMVKPIRISESRKINDYRIAGVFQNYRATDANYEGENASLTVSAKNEKIVPSVIDSTLKAMFLNRYKALSNVVTIQTGFDANPLDYIIESDGSVYVVVSKATVSDGVYILTCVLEINDTYSFTAPNITLIDTWHEVGASGEPSFQNSWTNWNGSSDTTAGFTKVGTRVYIKGTIKSGANNTAVFTLPTGYRPILHKQFPCLVWNSGWAPAGCHVSSAGVITVYFSAMSHWFSINGIDFDINT